MRLARLLPPGGPPRTDYEVKHDGFGQFANSSDGEVRLISRHSHVYRTRRTIELGARLAKVPRARGAILDGELVCLRRRGPLNVR